MRDTFLHTILTAKAHIELEISPLTYNPSNLSSLLSKIQPAYQSRITMSASDVMPMMKTVDANRFFRAQSLRYTDVCRRRNQACRSLLNSSLYQDVHQVGLSGRIFSLRHVDCLFRGYPPEQTRLKSVISSKDKHTVDVVAMLALSSNF